MSRMKSRVSKLEERLDVKNLTCPECGYIFPDESDSSEDKIDWSKLSVEELDICEKAIRLIEKAKNSES